MVKKIIPVAVLSLVTAFILLFAGALAPNGDAGDALEREEQAKYDKARAYEKYFIDQRAYPTGTIPDGAYARALDHAKSMPVSLEKAADTWSWISMGPTNIAGRVRAIVVDPQTPTTVYVGAAGGGIWKSTNEGATWRATSDYLPNLRINSLAIHPTNSSILLAGNGEGWVYWQGGYMWGRGIYRTDDGANTWYQIASTNKVNFEYVYDVAFDPNNPATILAATNYGVYRSSDDGATWTRKLPTGQKRAMQVVFAKNTPGLVYATLLSDAVYKSTDAGLTWTNMTAGKLFGLTNYDRIQIAVAPSDPTIVLASFVEVNTEVCIGMYKTTNGGTTWSSVSIPTNEFTADTYVGAQGSYNNVLAFNPTNPNKVFAGGIDLYYSGNGGNSWARISNAYTPSGLPFVHPDHHAIAFHPTSPRTMYFGHDGGIDRTLNEGTGFEKRNTGLTITQFHSVAPHPTSDRVIGGTIDNGNLLADGTSSFTDVTGGDGGYTIIDLANPNYVYAELYFATFYRATNGGLTRNSYVKAMSGIPQASQSHPQYPGTSDRTSFFAPFEIDPNNTATLYLGTYRLYRTTDRASNWTAISGDLSAAGGGATTTIAVAKSDSKVIYVGCSDGNIAVTTNSGTNWASVRTGLPNRYVTDIAIDYSNPATAYVTLSGFGSPHLFKTTNYGQQWSTVSGGGTTGLPDVPANTVIIYPTRPDRLIVGTDIGAFETRDAGATWYMVNNGMGNSTVSDLRLRPDGTLFAATHGRGIFRSSYSLLDTQTLNRPTDFLLHQNFPNPFNPATYIRYELAKSIPVTLEVRDVQGRLIRTLVQETQSPGSYTVEFNGTGFGSGLYIYRLTAGGNSASRAMMMLK